MRESNGRGRSNSSLCSVRGEEYVRLRHLIRYLATLKLVHRCLRHGVWLASDRRCGHCPLPLAAYIKSQVGPRLQRPFRSRQLAVRRHDGLIRASRYDALARRRLDERAQVFLFQWTLHGLRIFSPDSRGKGKSENWHAAAAGAVSAISVLAEKPSRRITYAQQLFVRSAMLLLSLFRWI